MGAIKPWTLLFCCIIVLLTISAVIAIVINATRKKK